MTLWNEVCLFYALLVFPVFLNNYFLRGWASQEWEFSKPVFPYILKFGMCIPKWFVSEATKAL